MGQSIVLGEIKAEVPLQNEDSMNHQILWQQYIQRIESLSPESKVSRFCKEAGFMRVVEVGQYFVTKDTGNLRQFRSVTCREYTLPRDDPASEAKGWIQGNMRIWLVLEVTTSFQHFKYGIEIRIWSVNQDNFQSWVKISYGTIKYVVDSIQDNTEIPADPQEEQVPQTSIKVVAVRSKAKAKPQPRVLVGTTATIPMHERRWIDIESSEQNLASFDLSKKVINLLRHKSGKTMEQLNSTKSNSIFEIIIHKYKFGLMIVGKLVSQQEEVRKEGISIALMILEEFFTSVLFRDTLDIISLILHYRTMLSFRVGHSITSTTLDVHSIFTLLSTMD